MLDAPTSVRSLFERARKATRQLDSLPNSSSETYQNGLQNVIQLLRECEAAADTTALFSRNETADDVASRDLQYVRRTCSRLC